MKKYNVILLLISIGTPAIAMQPFFQGLQTFQPQPPLKQFPTQIVVTSGNKPFVDAINAGEAVDLIDYERFLRSPALNGAPNGGSEAHIRNELAHMAGYNNSINRK